MVSSVLMSQSTTVIGTIVSGWKAEPPNPTIPVELQAMGLGVAESAYS